MTAGPPAWLSHRLLVAYSSGPAFCGTRGLHWARLMWRGMVREERVRLISTRHDNFLKAHKFTMNRLSLVGLQAFFLEWEAMSNLDRAAPS